MEDERCLCLALHLSNKFLTERVRRQWNAAGSLRSLAHVLLGEKFPEIMKRASIYFKDLDILAVTDADYPPLLREIDHAPFALFLKGQRALLKKKLVSIVGTREPSDAGRQATARVAAHFAGNDGFTVVSGIARGVDAIAHHAALDAGGSTIAVLPNGFAHFYPLENRDLYALAGSSPELLLVSEYPPEQKPQKHHFVRRNRIIAGLAELTIITEAGIKSGAMITANHALREGRDVAAIRTAAPMRNEGGERLLNDGAIDLSRLAFPV